MTKILQRDAPVLREVSSSVPIKNIKSKRIQDVIDRMKEALHAEEDGVAIAAPQIGESLRIFVVSGKALALAKKVKKMNDIKDLKDLVLINPEIINFQKNKRRWRRGVYPCAGFTAKLREVRKSPLEPVTKQVKYPREELRDS